MIIKVMLAIEPATTSGFAHAHEWVNAVVNMKMKVAKPDAAKIMANVFI